MKRHSLFALAVVTAVGALFTGCGGDSGSTSNLMGTIPAATGPVGASRLIKFPQDISKALMPVLGQVDSDLNGKSSSPRAFTMKAVDWTTNTWNGKSGPLCDIGQQVANTFRDAAQPDKILCYIQAMESASLFTGNNYDNTNKYYRVSMGREGVDVKFKIELNGTSIKDFKMWTSQTARAAQKRSRVCSNDEYIHAAFTGSTASITSKMNNSFGGSQFKGKVMASGTVDAEGNWLTKSIESWNWGDFGADEFGSYMDLDQYDGYLTLSAAMDGTFSGNTNSQLMYSKVQLVNASDRQNLEFGYGTTRFQAEWNPALEGPEADNYWAWNESGAPVAKASSTYWADVNQHALPATVIKTTMGTEATLKEPDGECWDGNPEGSFTTVTVNAAAQAGLAACDAKFGEGGGSWVSCWSSADYTISR